MGRTSLTFTADGSLTQVGFMKRNGIINVNGSFGGGTLTLFISFDAGVTKDALLDGSTAYSKTAADQFAFNLPIDDPDGLGAILFATLTGSTTPTLKIEILDDQR